MVGANHWQIGVVFEGSDEEIPLNLAGVLGVGFFAIFLQVKYRLWRCPSWVNHWRLGGESQMCEYLLNGILLQDSGNNFDFSLAELAMGDIGVKHPV